MHVLIYVKFTTDSEQNIEYWPIYTTRGLKVVCYSPGENEFSKMTAKFKFQRVSQYTNNIDFLFTF